MEHFINNDKKQHVKQFLDEETVADSKETITNDSSLVKKGAVSSNLINRAMTNPITLSTADILALQKVIGNKAVQRIIATNNHTTKKRYTSSSGLRLNNLSPDGYLDQSFAIQRQLKVAIDDLAKKILTVHPIGFSGVYLEDTTNIYYLRKSDGQLCEVNPNVLSRIKNGDLNPIVMDSAEEPKRTQFYLVKRDNDIDQLYLGFPNTANSQIVSDKTVRSEDNIKELSKMSEKDKQQFVAEVKKLIGKEEIPNVLNAMVNRLIANKANYQEAFNAFQIAYKRLGSLGSNMTPNELPGKEQLDKKLKILQAEAAKRQSLSIWSDGLPLKQVLMPGVGMWSKTNTTGTDKQYILWSGGAPICAIVAAYKPDTKEAFMTHAPPDELGTSEKLNKFIEDNKHNFKNAIAHIASEQLDKFAANLKVALKSLEVKSITEYKSKMLALNAKTGAVLSDFRVDELE